MHTNILMTLIAYGLLTWTAAVRADDAQIIAALQSKAKTLAAFRCKVAMSTLPPSDTLAPLDIEARVSAVSREPFLKGDLAMHLPGRMAMRLDGISRTHNVLDVGTLTLIRLADDGGEAVTADLTRLGKDIGLDPVVVMITAHLGNPLFDFMSVDSTTARILAQQEKGDRKVYVVAGDVVVLAGDRQSWIRQPAWVLVADDGMVRGVWHKHPDKILETLVTDIEVTPLLPQSLFTRPEGLKVQDVTDVLAQRYRRHPFAEDPSPAPAIVKELLASTLMNK